MNKTEEHLRELCKWPHRGTTTAYESLAADYARKKLEELGCHVDVEKFGAPKSGMYPTYMLMCGFAGVASIASFYFPAPAILLALAPLIYLFCEFFFRLPIHNLLFAKGNSQNVVGKFSNPNAKAKLVLSAHLDSQVGSYLFSPEWLGVMPIIANGATAGIVVSLLTATLKTAGLNWFAIDFLIAINAISMAVFFAMLAVAEWTGTYVQGASDDASGAAIMLSLAEDLRNVPPENLEVWIVATGAEEAGLCGMAHFMSKGVGKILNKNSSHFINFDNLGGGNLVYITGESIPGFKYPGQLVGLADEVVKDPHSTKADSGWWAVPTDALIPALRGFPAITIFGYDEKGRTPNYHYKTDTIENADLELPEKARAFTLDLIRKLDSRIA